MQVSNWGFSLADLKLQKKQQGKGMLNLGKGMLNWLKSVLSAAQDEYIGFLGPIHIWQVRSFFIVLHICFSQSIINCNTFLEEQVTRLVGNKKIND